MKYRILFLILFPQMLNAQCLSGNCENGNGRFDFGWCTYEGSFKNGKPEGQGVMRYSDYTYTGEFRNGVEDGNGAILRKNCGETGVAR
jgi:hypothetical protein